ncbi:MAG TPA: ABC transporter permease [Candidatus Acidoferrales bacterium]|nr:ABC transporter permease [Candidatus Acidoferrales bacterium]
MNTFWQDVRYALRMLVKSPMLTVIVTLTLALGIGANTAIFGIVNGFLLRPLPARSPEQIMVIAGKMTNDTIGVPTLSYPELTDLRKQATVFSDVFASETSIGGLSFAGRTEEFVFSYVTGNYFTALGMQPALGHFFAPPQGETGGKDSYLVLGYSYWQKRFGGDPAVIGKQALLGGEEAIIIGVAPKGFQGTQFAVDTEGYVPLNMLSNAAQFWPDRTARNLSVFARLKSGVGLKQAESSVSLVAARLAEQYPATDKGVSLRLIPERFARPQPFTTNIVPFIAGLFLVLAGLVLLLACMNVANILLVRATVRQREMAIRAALGAGRTRLMRQLLTESMVLAFFGAIGGFLLGKWSSGTIPLLLPKTTGIPIHLDFSFDWRVFVYALAAALFTGVVMGLWPALRASRADVNAVLHGEGRSDSAGSSRHRLRSVLVVAQVSGSLVLLIVAGLFVRSLIGAQRAYLGFDPDHVLNVTLDPNEAGYDAARTNNFYKELERRASALPGVSSASLAFSVPMGVSSATSQVYVEGRVLPPGQQAPLVFYNDVDAGYFDTMRVPLLRGRAFTQNDDEKAQRVAVVNQAMAKQFWPTENPIGKRFSVTAATGPFIQIVGVAADGKYVFLGWSHQPFYYVPLAQNYQSYRTLQLRTSIPPDSVIPQVESEIHALDPAVPISDIRSMKESLSGANGYFLFRVGATLAASLGILGLILAVVGVYGVVSYAASQRTHEIGIRMALGANRWNILLLVLRQGLLLVTAGVVVGLALAFALTRSMATLLIGVGPTDALTFVSTTLMLAAIGFWACYAPARRAMRLDPMRALRHE